MYWSFRFSVSLSSEYSGLISIRIDYLQQVANQIPGIPNLSPCDVLFLFGLLGS